LILSLFYDNHTFFSFDLFIFSKTIKREKEEVVVFSISKIFFFLPLQLFLQKYTLKTSLPLSLTFGFLLTTFSPDIIIIITAAYSTTARTR